MNSEFDKVDRAGNIESRTVFKDNYQRKIVYVIDHNTGTADVRYDSDRKIEGAEGSVSEIEKLVNK